MRTTTDTWAREGQFLGKRNFWTLRDHIDGDMVRLGIVLLFVFPASGLQCINERFELGANLGSGVYGSVCEAMDLSTGRANLAAKVSRSRWDMSLLVEYDILRRLAGIDGFPSAIGLFCNDDCEEMLVMQRLHRDIESLKRDPEVARDGRLSAGTVAEVGIQCIERLKQLHAIGVVHRDLKSHNIMIGSERSEVIYLIDFGLSGFYQCAGRHISWREGFVCGNACFGSVHTHNGEHSRRSDLESLAYLLIYLAAGSLPWQGIKAATKEERNQLVLEKKRDMALLEKHTMERLPDQPNLVNAMLGMVRYCRSLRFEGEPDYEQLAVVLQLAVPTAMGDSLPSICEVAQELADEHALPEPILDWLACDGRLTPAARKRTDNPKSSSPFFPLQDTTAATWHRDFSSDPSPSLGQMEVATSEENSS